MARTETVLTIKQIGVALPRFGVRYEERTLRYALRGIGVEPVGHVANESTGKGRILLYDALVPVVVACAYQALLGGSLRQLDRPLDRHRAVAAKKSSRSAIGQERLAGYMFILSAEYGFDVPRLQPIVAGDPSLTEILPEDAEFLVDLLKHYQRERAEWEARLNIFGESEPTSHGIDSLAASTLTALSSALQVSSPHVAVNAQSLVQERFSISEFFDGTWRP